MKADALHHHRHYHHQHHPDHQPVVPMAAQPQQHHQYHNKQQAQQRVVYLQAACPIEERTPPSLGDRQQASIALDHSPKYRWSRSLSLGGRGKRSQSLGRDTLDTSAPPSLHKNSIYNKTLSWLRNLRTTSNKNRSNSHADSGSNTPRDGESGTPSKDSCKEESRTYKDPKRYSREGGEDPHRTVAAQESVSSHGLTGGSSQDRHYYHQPSGTSKYRHSVIGHVTQDQYPGDSYSANIDYFEQHYPRIKTVEPHVETHQVAVAGPSPSSQEQRVADDHLRSSTSRGSKPTSRHAANDNAQHRHSVIGDVSYIQDYQQHQHYHHAQRHLHPGHHHHLDGPPDQAHGFSREQRTFSASTQGIDNPGFSESSDHSAGPTPDAAESDGGSHRSTASSVGSTVTRILRARLFGRAKSSISLHLEKGPPPPSLSKDLARPASHPKELLPHAHPHPHVHPRPASSVSALNLGTDYNISAVKLRPKKGQCDSKHVYVVNKDTKPSRPRSCATLPRDAKLGKAVTVTDGRLHGLI